MVEALLRHDDELREIAKLLRTRTEHALESVARLRDDARALEKARATPARAPQAPTPTRSSRGTDIDGAAVLTAVVDVADEQALLALMDRLKAKLGDAVIVLGSAEEGRVALVAAVAPSLVARGVKAGSIVRVAAEVAGGGGGGRDTMARAGGKHPEKLGLGARGA